MRSLWKAVIRQFKTLDLLPDYFRSVKAEAWNLAWGPGIIAIAFCSWWFERKTAMPPLNVVLFLGGALVLAGYYLWRADHIRLMPKLEFVRQVFVESQKADSLDMRDCVQVLPKCATSAPVEQCQGHLLRVLRWDGIRWQPTALSEPFELKWSFYGAAPRTLRPGVEQRLNILCVDANSIDLDVEPKPEKPQDVFRADETYRFDVRVTAKDCPPIEISVSVTIKEQTPLRMNERLPMPIVTRVISGDS